ncbi:MAG: hypothetical protein JWP08_2642 [Bryobacterales bacterium]|nr:hypothetical protein [Bryobacterales bacterium]
MSDHVHHGAVQIPEIRLGSRASGIERTAGVIGALGLLLCCAGYWANHEHFFQSYLFAFLYWAGFGIGGLGVLLLNNVVGGKWGVTTRSLLIAAMRTLPIIFVLLLPILFLGLKDIYPWTHPDLVSQNEYLWHKKGYLNVPFFMVRVVIYFAVWLFWGWRVTKMADRQDQTGDETLLVRMRQFSAPGLLIFVLTATFAYIDWVLSTDVQFYSTVYGAMILIGDVLQTLALTIVVLILASKTDRFGGRINSSLLHDLGNLMFAFTIFWTYLSVSQLIIIWPADLPQEIQWYLVRVRGGWTVVAAGIAIIMFVVPFLALLSQARKQNPNRLIRVAIWILCARAVELFWIVEPTFRNKGFALYWTDFAAFIGVGGIWVYVYLGQLRRRPLLPLRDPRVMAPSALPEAAAL